MPLEVKRHAVPHLKALTIGIENKVIIGMATLLSSTTLSYKVPILLHKQAKQ